MLQALRFSALLNALGGHSQRPRLYREFESRGVRRNPEFGARGDPLARHAARSMPALNPLAAGSLRAER